MEDTQTFLTTIRHQFEWALAKKKTFSTNILPSRWFTETDLCVAILILVTLKYLKKHIHIIIGPGHVNCRFPTCNCSWCIYQFWYQHVFPLVRLTVGPMKKWGNSADVFLVFCPVPVLFRVFVLFPFFLRALGNSRKETENIGDNSGPFATAHHPSSFVEKRRYRSI